MLSFFFWFEGTSGCLQVFQGSCLWCFEVFGTVL